MPCPPRPNVPSAAKHFEKGHVYWHDFRGQIGRRPGIIISRHRPGSSEVTIALITDAVNVLQNGKIPYPYQALVLKSECPGLDIDSVIKLDRIWTIRRQWLCDEWYIGEAAPNVLPRVDGAIIYALDLQPFLRDFVLDAINQSMGGYQANFERR